MKDLDSILQILYSVKEDKAKLSKILTFLETEIDEEQDQHEEIQVPEKFTKVVAEIADSIDAGLTCFLNLDTLEVEEIPKNDLELFYDDQDDDENDSSDEPLMKHFDWENFLEVEPLESNESFRIMEAFAENLEDHHFQNKLVNTLRNRKPFANFKFAIDNSPYRQQWFGFKKKWLENYVKELLILKLDKDSNALPS